MPTALPPPSVFPDLEPLINLTCAAYVLGMSKDALRRLCRSRLISYRKLAGSKRYMFSGHDLKAYISGTATEATQ